MLIVLILTALGAYLLIAPRSFRKTFGKSLGQNSYKIMKNATLIAIVMLGVSYYLMFHNKSINKSVIDWLEKNVATDKTGKTYIWLEKQRLPTT